jgi:DNA-binding NarL/FixJ family response regulator
MVAQIFIVEDHPAVRSGYILLLHRELDLAVCGAVASGEEALMRIPHCQPDLVLVDLFLTGMYGLTLIAHLHQTQPALPILIVSSRERMVLAMRQSPALPPNLKGYLHKQEVPQLLVPTIRRILVTGRSGVGT